MSSDSAPQPPTEPFRGRPRDDRDDPTLQRLDGQIEWYDRKSAENQRRFKLLKGVQLVAAATIPVTAAFSAHPAVAAILGALIVVVEGFQQLNQYQQNWTLYRSNAEALKHEKYLFLARAGPYARTEDGRSLLADRIEGLISQEHAKWVSARQERGEEKDA
ncbi:MAG TPA: DUF4231 domain-containing protein [Actinomycetota bacterium]|nr:DUF4231 domain-containing protein [Actinomycetota bacterium]